MANETESQITDELRAALGREFPAVTSCDKLSTSEVRRFAQATVDDSPIYYDEDHARNLKYGGVVAPGSYPITGARRRASGTPDPLKSVSTDSRAEESVETTKGIPWPPHLLVFHAYSDLEIHQLARVGDRITQHRRLADAYEKTGRSGRLLFIVTENTFVNQNGDVLCTERYVDVGVEN